MATPVKNSCEERESFTGRSAAPSEGTSTTSTSETEQQDGLEDIQLQKPQLSEPCIS